MKKLIKSLRLTFLWTRDMFEGIFALTTPRLRLRGFSGYFHWSLAKAYARRRFKADGKTYYVLPYGNETLIVANRIELNRMKSSGMIKKSLNIDTVLKAAYYRANKSNVK